MIDTDSVSPKIGEKIFSMIYLRKAVSKGRPRFSKHGHAYTPEKTRKFEKEIRDQAKYNIEHPIADYPLIVELNFVNVVPKSWPQYLKEAANAGYLLPTVGDVDNQGKAITDALNGLVYADDSLVSVSNVRRSFGTREEIRIQIYRLGLSKEDVKILRKAKNV